MSDLDERLGEALDGNAEAAVAEPEREAAAARLMVHGLLAEKARRTGTDTVVAAALLRMPARNRWWKPVSGLVAAALAAAAFLLVFTWEPALPTADAMFAKVEAEFASGAAREYLGRVFSTKTGDLIRTTHWSFKDGRFVFDFPARTGTAWCGGDGKTSWVVGARGRTLRPRDRAALREHLQAQGYTAAFTNLPELVAELKKSYVVTVVGREAIPARDGKVVHMRAVRSDAKDGVASADFWADEKSGVVVQLEARVLQAGGEPTRHFLELVPGEARPDNWYMPEGHGGK